MKPLINLLIRIASGERYEKSKPEDHRWWFSYFFFAGLLMMCIFPAKAFFDHASNLKIWISSITALSVFAVALIVWAQRVPAKVSLVLGIVTWGAFVWLALKETP